MMRVLIVATLVALMTCPAGASGDVTPEQRALVPAYFYPDHRDEGNPWRVMCDDPGASAPGSVLIMNPHNGPATSVNSDYVEAIASCQSAGQDVIGYVSTSYGLRGTRAVKADIDAYFRYYPDLDGIFLDEMSTDRATQTYYRNLYRHVKARSSAPKLVVGNPGAAAATSWQLDVPVADAVVVFEGHASTFAQWSPPTWVAAQPSSRIAVLVHASPEEADMTASCARSRSANAGLAYVTDDVLPNPWDSLPSYWQQELQAC